MRSPLERLVFLLAASGLTAKEIEFALENIKRLPRTLIPRMVMKIRHEMSSERYFEPYSWIDMEIDSRTGNYFKQSAGAASRAEKMLRKKGSQKVSDVVNAIMKNARRFGLNPSSLPEFRKKDGFSAWLQKLEAQLGGKKLLQLASAASSQMERKNLSDWPLRGS